MKELEERLRADAAQIRAEVDPALRARIHASIAATRPERKPTRSRPLPARLPRWALGAATAAGVAVAALLLVRPEAPTAPEFSATPTAVREDGGQRPVAALRAEFALLELEAMATRPLEEEQQKLEADLERIQEELRRSF
ncbi:MAG: hypothetical protein P8172_15405 [Gammaproteobacteria bacterium]